MTDKLPIERLERLADWLDSEGNESAHDARDAILELISIRKAEPVAYGLPNTAITGMPHALMQLAIEIPSNDQYGGALWLPLIIKP